MIERRNVRRVEADGLSMAVGRMEMPQWLGIEVPPGSESRAFAHEGFPPRFKEVFNSVGITCFTFNPWASVTELA